jgi:arylsulfatase A-like enzyme
MSTFSADTENSRRAFLKKSAAATAGVFALDASGSKAAIENPPSHKRPNIVFFHGEGMRSDELSCAGNSIIHTPNFDRIIHQGTSFRNSFCTNAICSPSRATALTGMYSHSTGVVDLRPRAIPDSIPTLAELFRQAGYEVGMFGKVHVHDMEKRNWDYYFGIGGAEANYYHPMITESENGNVKVPKQFEGYFDDLVTDRALEWMNQPRQKPFCLFLWFMAPHAPFYRARRHADLYNGVAIPKPTTFDDDLKGYPGKPHAFTVGMNKIVTGVYANDDPRTLEELVKDHYAGVVATDDNAGRVMGALEKRGELDDTVIMLSSDHGFFLGEWGLYNKMLMHEPSIRVPLAIRYPRLVKSGAKCDRMVLNVDLAPTLLDLAGVAMPDTIQGRSLVPFLKGGDTPDWRKDWLYEYYDERFASRSRGIRTEKYKLIHYWESPEEFELYDLEADPRELNNLYGDLRYAKIAEQLKTRIHELRVETKDPSLLGWFPNLAL